MNPCPFLRAGEFEWFSKKSVAPGTLSFMAIGP